jgi:hypothetical protein
MRSYHPDDIPLHDDRSRQQQCYYNVLTGQHILYRHSQITITWLLITHVAAGLHAR